MKDLEIAREFEAGTRTDPVMSNGYMLIPLRITGTGEKEREYKGRKYNFIRPLNDFQSEDFLKECCGLPITVGHPKEGMVLADNFDGVVGTVFYPFIKEEEVWGVCKIYKPEVFLMEEIQSTSPLVLSDNHLSEDGDLVEDFQHINHVALVTDGFWDKKEDGQITQIGVDIMAEEKKEDEAPAVEEKKEDAEETPAVEEKKEDVMPTPAPAPAVEEKKEDAEEKKEDSEMSEIEQLKARIEELEKTEKQEASSFEELAQEHEEYTEEDREKDTVLDELMYMADDAQGGLSTEIKVLKPHRNESFASYIKSILKSNSKFVPVEYKSVIAKIDDKDIGLTRLIYGKMKENMNANKALNLENIGSGSLKPSYVNTGKDQLTDVNFGKRFGRGI